MGQAGAGAGEAVAVESSTLIQGAVMHAGAPREGARVEVRVWPAQDALARLSDGARVAAYELPAVSTDPDGRFSVALPPSAVPKKHKSAEGVVDLELVVHDGKTSSISHVSVVMAQGSASRRGGWVLAGGSAGSAATLNIDLETAAALPRGTSQSKRACAWNKTSSTTIAAADSAHLWTPSTDVARPSFAYRSGSDHTLGVAYSSNGSVFVASGSNTRSAAAGFTANAGANVLVEAKWRYRKYLYDCGGAKWVPESFYSGPHYTYSAYRSFSYACTAYYAGDVFYRASGKNQTYSTGATVAGVGLVSQVGYTSETSISFDFRSKGYMCASSSAGLGGAPYVGAKR